MGDSTRQCPGGEQLWRYSSVTVCRGVCLTRLEETQSDEDWQRILEVNLLAAVGLDRAFIPGMIERKSGVIIHISSIAHRLPFPPPPLALQYLI
jgi:NAD(P)-dependent dehydrogenase (short-subunit alcohol dehydrogenase family)